MNKDIIFIYTITHTGTQFSAHWLENLPYICSRVLWLHDIWFGPDVYDDPVLQRLVAGKEISTIQFKELISNFRCSDMFTHYLIGKNVSLEQTNDFLFNHPDIYVVLTIRNPYLVYRSHVLRSNDLETLLSIRPDNFVIRFYNLLLDFIAHFRGKLFHYPIDKYSLLEPEKRLSEFSNRFESSLDLPLAGQAREIVKKWKNRWQIQSGFRRELNAEEKEFIDNQITCSDVLSRLRDLGYSYEGFEDIKPYGT